LRRSIGMKKGTISILSALLGAGAGAAGMGRSIGKRVEQERQMSDKHLSLFLMMNKWVKVKQEGKCLASYFEKKNFHEIAIYGMSYAGETFAEELNGSGIKIRYGIDQKADTIYSEFDIVSPDEDLEEVDAVVVTSITFFTEIEKKLRGKISCPIISLEDILYDM